MRVKFGYGVCVAIVSGCITFFVSANDIPVGTYSYSQQGEDLIDGQSARITWNIEIKDDKNAVVTVSSWHAPFSCDGKYIVSNEGEALALSWSSNDNADTECGTPSPQILLKKSPTGKVLVHSELFMWDPNGWKNTHAIR